ncbi:MAG: hypothetical protein FDW93_07055 [Bergeyella sp.]|nr:hypothetical protein [Bergeyella sp.]
MLRELEDSFSLLERRILRKKKEFRELGESYREVLQELEQVREKYREERKRSQELAEENRRIKLLSTLAGNLEHSRLMKNHINRLIKEVDFCIDHLRNKGL